MPSYKKYVIFKRALESYKRAQMLILERSNHLSFLKFNFLTYVMEIAPPGTAVRIKQVKCCSEPRGRVRGWRAQILEPACFVWNLASTFNSCVALGKLLKLSSLIFLIYVIAIRKIIFPITRLLASRSIITHSDLKFFHWIDLKEKSTGNVERWVKWLDSLVQVADSLFCGTLCCDNSIQSLWRVKR